MLNVPALLKTPVASLPLPLAKLVARAPFSVRFGSAYQNARMQIARVGAMDTTERQSWTLARLRSIVEHAYARNVFYRELYDRAGFTPDQLKTLDHFKDVPIVTKSDLAAYTVERRTTRALGRLYLNTGGSSGAPLDFYVDGNAFAREWAHMHGIWCTHGYNYRHIKLTFRGKNLGDRPFLYNPAHNEYLVNTYADPRAVLPKLARLRDFDTIRWLHGYPSIVAEWCGVLSTEFPEIAARLRATLLGVLLGSEFPTKPYRDSISRAVQAPIVAWYGHSEMSVLAAESSENVYVPMPTYGYAESVACGGGASHLVATSFWNTAGPFIRYNTEDGIDGETADGLLRRFSIVDGRIGDFVVDKLGRRIGLTAFIFGRHHPAFGQLRHIQVSQSRPGNVELLVVPNEPLCRAEDLLKGFDLSHVPLDVSLTVLDRPVRTRSGKIPLLVRKREPSETSPARP